jgi:hypothetical protein
MAMKLDKFIKEEFRDIKGFEGLYQISNFGRVKSLKRIIERSDGRKALIKERIRKTYIDKGGYVKIFLNIEAKNKGYMVHNLVWNAFGNRKTNGRTIHVDHINNDTTDNNINNLQALTARQNIVKASKRKKKLSKYTGITLNKATNKWVAQIRLGKKALNLGYFKEEIDAYFAYRERLYKYEGMVSY